MIHNLAVMRKCRRWSELGHECSIAVWQQLLSNTVYSPSPWSLGESVVHGAVQKVVNLAEATTGLAREISVYRYFCLSYSTFTHFMLHTRFVLTTSFTLTMHPLYVFHAICCTPKSILPLLLKQVGLTHTSLPRVAKEHHFNHMKVFMAIFAVELIFSGQSVATVFPLSFSLACGDGSKPQVYRLSRSVSGWFWPGGGGLEPGRPFGVRVGSSSG